MLDLYKVQVEKKDDSELYQITCEELGIQYTVSGTKEQITTSIKEMILRNAILRFSQGTPQPHPTQEFPEGTFYFLTDVYREVQTRLGKQAVRKNISLPEWMDTKLKYLDIDASSLFQEAAMKAIKEYETQR